MSVWRNGSIDNLLPIVVVNWVIFRARHLVTGSYFVTSCVILATHHEVDVVHQLGAVRVERYVWPGFGQCGVVHGWGSI